VTEARQIAGAPAPIDEQDVRPGEDAFLRVKMFGAVLKGEFPACALIRRRGVTPGLAHYDEVPLEDILIPRRGALYVVKDPR